MTEEKKPVQKQSKKTEVPKKEISKPAQKKKEDVKAESISKKPAAQKSLCRHLVHEDLGKGKIIEELTVNNKDCYRIKFENLKKAIVFKKEEIIKE